MIKFNKNNLVYYLFSFTLLIITLLLSSTFYNNTNINIQVPFQSLFGNLSWGIVAGLGLIGIFLVKKLFDKNVRVENIFICIAIPIGLLFMFCNPLGKVTDEDIQVRKIMAIASGNIFSKANENSEASDFFDGKLDELVNRDIISYEDLYNRFQIEDNAEVQSMGYTTMALYSPVCHMPQAVGMIIGNILNLNLQTKCYLSRLSNFLINITIIYFAIKFIPFKKELLLFISLLPLTFNQLASMSADGITISSIVFFISYVLYLKYDSKKEKITKKDIGILAIFSIIVSQCKIVYLPICFFSLIITKDKFNSAKSRRIILYSIIGISVVLNLCWLVYCTRFLTEFNAGVSAADQVKYILTNPIAYILIIARTISTNFQYHVLCLVGEGLGSFNVQASVFYVLINLITLVFLLVVNFDTTVKLELRTRIVSFLIFAATVALIFTSVYVQWNPVHSIKIEGIQGRYFFPFMILIAFFIMNNKFTFNGKLDNKYLIIYSLFVNLNVITAILYTYIYATPVNFYIK